MFKGFKPFLTLKGLVLIACLQGVVPQSDPQDEDAFAEYENQVNSDIYNRLNNIATDYERMMNRNGKFLFAHRFYQQPYERPVVEYKPIPEMPKFETFDFVIVGSGSAGSALANRLSENPHWKILLLEVGKQPSFITDIPGICATFQLTDFNWGYLMEKQDNMCLGLENQRMAWPRGRALGGSSIINYMIHVRGNRRDYDRWAAMGNPGWSYNDVLPYFKKLEDNSVRYTDHIYRNRGGPIGVQDVPFRSEVVDAYVKSCMEAGHKYVDYNGKRQLGVSYVQATTRRGKRVSGESAYLRPIRDRPNLTILTEARATKLIIDDNQRVTGVQYVRNRQFHYANVTKEAILSAGTFMTPQLLMLSGIGPQSHLQELGIPVIRDLPVGQKMYDHATFPGVVFTVNETIGINYADLTNPRSMIQLLNGQGPLTSIGGVEALTYIRTNVSRDHDLKYPDMELIFIGGSFATDYGLVYRKTFRITDEVYNAFWKPLEPIARQTWSVMPMLVHPHSIGMVRLKSRNPYHWPRLFGNFFTDPENLDVKTFIAAIREVQRISTSPTFQRFNSQQVKTKIPGCYQHEWDTDQYWECALRHITGTLHHQVATAKMGPPTDPEAVVDPTLKVYGVQGLRIADCSVIPLPLTAHTNIPAMMVGEKAADLIKTEWGATTAGTFDPRV